MGGISARIEQPYLEGTYNYVDIVISKDNLEAAGKIITTYDESDSYFRMHRSVVTHEIGHALSLGHTDGTDSDISYTTFTRNNKIHEKFKIYSTDQVGNIPLLMNSKYGAGSDSHTFVDRDHLRIKWGI